MPQLPLPSDTPQIVMNTGTLSGINVLQVGRVEPGAIVQLASGNAAEVLQVRGKRLSARGVLPGSVRIRLLEDGTPDQWVRGRDIAAVLRQPANPERAQTDSGTPGAAGAAPA